MSSSLSPSRASRTLASWFQHDPFRALQNEMDHMLCGFTGPRDGNVFLAESMRIPSVDVSEIDGELQIEVDVPGMKAKEIGIEVVGKTVLISGGHSERKVENNRAYHRIERCSGSFVRSVDLPCAVKEDEIVAVYKDGVLKITLPKSDEANRRRVIVSSNAQ